MGTYENFYLNKIKKLQEENTQLKNLLFEMEQATQAPPVNTPNNPENPANPNTPNNLSPKPIHRPTYFRPQLKPGFEGLVPLPQEVDPLAERLQRQLSPWANPYQYY